MIEKIIKAVAPAALGVLIATVYFVGMAVLAPLKPIEAQPLPGFQVMRSYQSGTVATGAEAEILIDFTNTDGQDQTYSIDCVFTNADDTNAIDLEFNDGVDEILLRPGASFNSASFPYPFMITKFRHEAVAGTPTLDYACFGR